MLSALIVIGTRPEAIKLAPVAQALAERGRVRPVVVTTGQHGAVVEDVLDLFGLEAEVDLGVARRPDGALSGLHADLMSVIDRAVDKLRPDAVMVEGDTTSVAAAAQVGFLRGLPVVHVEAGLRSGSLAAPFPEEGNRRLVAAVASLHLAPTESAAGNLRAEGHDPLHIVVTGNTVIDALRHAVNAPTAMPNARLESIVSGAGAGSRGVGGLVVVTAHRRESWGPGMGRIAQAVGQLARSHPEVTFVAVTHMNPAVRDPFVSALAGLANVDLAEPLTYGQFVRLLARARLVLTDSGGIQEEAPELGVRALVMRERTERTEGLEAGAAVLVGTDTAGIVTAADELLAQAWPPAPAGPTPTLYGDGRAGRRCAQATEWLLGLSDRPEPFRPRPPSPAPF